MKISNSLIGIEHPFVRLALATALAAAVSPGAVAAGSSNTAASLERVEVIGSRIKKSESEGDSPVQVITSKDIEDSGLKTIGDILQQLSVSGSALNTKFNSAGNFGFPPDGGGVGSGSTTISLRNLGSKRVLVLVDGIRWVNESSASGVSASVDLNTIPASTIERVELLTDGASSLYGSDAIAGVVNVVTKKSQKGGSLNFYAGDYQIGDGRTFSGDASYGGSGQGFKFFVDLSHYEQHAISSGDWGQSSYPVPGLGIAEGSSATPNTRTDFTPVDLANTYGGLCPLSDTNGDGIPDPNTAYCDVTRNSNATQPVPTFPDQFHAFTSADRFNYAPYNDLLTPTKRTGFFSQVSFDLSEDVTGYVKGLYQTRKSINQAAPEPIFLGPGSGSGLASTVNVDSTNPYNPFDPGTSFDFIGRRPIEGGPRVFEQNVDTLYLAGGLQGSFALFKRDYSWNVNYANGSNKATQTVNGTYNVAHIKTALGPVADCVAPCVPLNIFGGPGTITPEMLNYIEFVENDQSTQKIALWTANISGPVVKLPAGDLEFAGGYEHRQLEGSYMPDAIVVAGEGNGVPSLPTTGGYSVNEGYVELNVPVLAGITGAKALDLSIASRYSDYSSFGNTTNNKFGLRWLPFADLTLRGTYAEGFRAPSIGELYGSPARFDADLQDPCNGTVVAGDNCNQLGVPVGNFQQINTQIGIQTGGNTQLQPEKSKSYTSGFVYSPSWATDVKWAKHVDFVLNYYSIEVDNAIQSPNAQTQLNRCVASLDPIFCDGITRGSTGDIVKFSNTLENLGTIKTSGMDLSMDWRGPKTLYGRPGVTWQATYVIKYEAIATDSGLAEPNAVGVEVADSGIPRWRSTLRLTDEIGNITGMWTVRYISGLRESCGDAQGTAYCSDSAGGDTGTNQLSDVAYNDARISWKVPVSKNNLVLAAGVNNVFDQGSPMCESCSLNGYDASLYDLPGRYAYAEATWKF